MLFLKFLTYSIFCVIATLVVALGFGVTIDFTTLNQIDSVKIAIFTLLILSPPPLVYVVSYFQLKRIYFKNNRENRALSNSYKILGQSIHEWSKYFSGKTENILFKNLLIDGNKDAIKYLILLYQTKTTFMDVLDDRYLRGDDFYKNYLLKLDDVYKDMINNIEEIHDIKVTTRKYNERIKLEKREEDYAAGDDERTNQLINEMNISKGSRKIKDNYRSIWESIQLLQNLMLEIADEPSHHKPYSQTSREEMMLQVTNFRKSF